MSDSISPPIAAVALGFLVAVFYLLNREQPGLDPVELPPQWDESVISLPKDDQIIRIASFNIQKLGQSKMQKTVEDETGKTHNVSDILAEIILQFDVVAIQELQSKEQTVIPELIRLINRGGRNYAEVVGPRVGLEDSTYREQYVYIYDSDRIELERRMDPFMADDPGDEMHREPYVAQFRVKGDSRLDSFSFTLMNVHTDPDLIKKELPALADIFERTRGLIRTSEDDLILLGDLNRKSKLFQKPDELGQIPNLKWVVTGDTPTNTRDSEQHDNIVFTTPETDEYTGKWGVYNFKKRFSLSEKAALRVSDHYPIWGEFSILEK